MDKIYFKCPSCNNTGILINHFDIKENYISEKYNKDNYKRIIKRDKPKRCLVCAPFIIREKYIKVPYECLPVLVQWKEYLNYDD